MADSSFLVKNALVVSNTVTINATGYYISGSFVTNATSYVGTANNSLYLGGTLSASYVQNTESRTLSGNLVFSGANTRFTGASVDALNFTINGNTVYTTDNFSPSGLAANAAGAAIALAIALG